LVGGAAVALSNKTNVVVNLATLVAGDANADTLARDQDPGLFQIPLSTADGKRTGSREFVVAVRDAKVSPKRDNVATQLIACRTMTAQRSTLLMSD